MVLNYILFENIIRLYLQFLCAAGYLKRSNDTPNLNIHKYTDYNTIEIYIKNADFHVHGLLDTDVREVPSF